MALVRIPVLLALLVASGPLQWRYAQKRFVFTAEGAVSSVGPWLALVGVAIVFILVAAYARDRRHATPVLLVEALLAIVITMVPPLIWAQVAAGPWTEAMGGTTGASYAQILALVWLLIVVRTVRDQRRRA
jgi:hypothetical protein